MYIWRERDRDVTIYIHIQSQFTHEYIHKYNPYIVSIPTQQPKDGTKVRSTHAFTSETQT